MVWIVLIYFSLMVTWRRKPSRWAWWKALNACLTPSSAERLEEPAVSTSGVMRGVDDTSQPCTQGWQSSAPIRSLRRGSTVSNPAITHHVHMSDTSKILCLLSFAKNELCDGWQYLLWDIQSTSRRRTKYNPAHGSTLKISLWFLRVKLQAAGRRVSFKN